jgi:hypothetical protein
MYIHIQLAREGLPGMKEQELDAKKDLDKVLKAACTSMKQSALKMLLGTYICIYICICIHQIYVRIRIEGLCQSALKMLLGMCKYMYLYV